MTNSLFDLAKKLYIQIKDENLDIHSIQETLNRLVAIGRDNDKLRIITYFLSVLEVLARIYEYDDVSQIVRIKGIIKGALEILISMVEGKYTNQQGAEQIKIYLHDIRAYIINKIEDKPFIMDTKLLFQYGYDLKKDITYIESLFLNPILVSNEQHFYNTTKYYLYRILDNTKFVGLKHIEKLVESVVVFVEAQYKERKFFDISANAIFIDAIKELKKIGQMIINASDNIETLKTQIQSLESQKEISPIEHSEYIPKDNIFPIISEEERQSAVTLTDDEVMALMSDNYSVEMVSFDEPEIHNDKFFQESKKAISPIKSHQIKNNEYQSLIKAKYNQQTETTTSVIFEGSNEERLIRYLGRLFQKHDHMYNELTNEQKVSLMEDISEMNTLTSNIKTMLFSHYYTSIDTLLGEDLRTFINQEVKQLGKQIRLGILGEDCEILTSMNEFVKHVVFTLVKNSLHYSLEPIFRRRAIDKNEKGWLLIEFSESGDLFDIFVKDDGKGLLSEHMNLPELEQSIQEKGGTLAIDVVENEYMKIHVQLPMKKIITDCLVVKLGDTHVLLPSKSIDRIIDQKDLAIALRDEKCIGHANLSILLGLGKQPTNMLIVCNFNNKKFIFGVDKVLYNIEALIENVDVPLLPAADFVSILKDGSLGFIMNERKLEELAKKTITKRKTMTHIVK